jgi:hypothetical protein
MQKQTWRPSDGVQHHPDGASGREGVLAVVPRSPNANLVASTTDALGRKIILTEERWTHIVDGHPELDGLELALMRAVEAADITVDGKTADTKRVCAKDLGPARYLVVVVRYAGQTGYVRTAYPTSKEPKTP